MPVDFQVDIIGVWRRYESLSEVLMAPCEKMAESNISGTSMASRVWYTRWLEVVVRLPGYIIKESNIRLE